MANSHREQLRAALQFFRGRVKGTIDEIHAAVRDVKEDELDSSAMFNRDDVAALLDQLTSSLTDVVRTDLEELIAMNGLLLSQLFEGAEAAGASLATNLARVEDRELLAGMAGLEADASSGCLSPSTKLSSSRDDSLRLARDNRALKEENGALRSELAVLKSAGRSASAGDADDGGGGGRFADSREFQQMKRILESKNFTVRELRERLAKFEDDDEDDFV
jgi:cell division septum initiation protein DivIVA